MANRAAVLLLATIGWLSGCDGTVEDETAEVTLSGIVRESQSNAPVSGVAVTAGSSTTTGADGRYEFTDVMAGTQTITATLDGYADYSASFLLQQGSNTHNIQLQALATVSGTVREAATNAPVSGVQVSAGDAQTMSGADGSFVLEGVPVGQHGVVATADGYNTYSETISVEKGGNTHDIYLDYKSLYTYQADEVDFVIHVLREAPMFRGVLLVLAGTSGQTVDLLYGEGVFGADPAAIAARDSFFQVADRNSLALMGADYHDNDTHSARQDVFLALEAFAESTGHAELAHVPLLVNGHSLGGCFAWGLVRDRPERIAGFITAKGGCHISGHPEQGQSVPGYLFIGGEDTDSRRDNITSAFELYRAGGALWSLAVQPGSGHEPVEATEEGRALTGSWTDAVFDLRLPPAGSPDDPVVLNPIDESMGWLGNRDTFEIAAYDCYDGDKELASWLPTMETAQEWQAFVSGGSVTTIGSCD